MRNRQMIVHSLMAHTKSIEVAWHKDIHEPEATKTFYRVVDQDEWHRGACALLKEVQRIKSEGDYAAAAKLFQDHGIKFDPKLRDEVVARFERQKLPSYSGFVFPKLTARFGADGAIEAVDISYPCDLEAQMLEWSGRAAPAPAPAPAGAATGAR
jgi:dipeptidyl-peptidase-3